MNRTIIATAKNGLPIVSYEYIEQLREADERHPDPSNIIAQTGGQEKLLSATADITIYGGMRGGAKSFSMLMDNLNDCYNPNFKAIIMRKEIDDLSDMVESSKQVFSQFGEYNRSRADMTWNFHSGGWLKFGYHSGSYEDFRDRYQGRQYAFIGIDECTQMSYNKFKYIITCNRNASFIRNRVIGTCNPDPDSWVAQFIDWWLLDSGLPDPEKDGVIRYCFMEGDDVSTIIWGNTREEVYRQCRDTIDRLAKKYGDLGDPMDIFIMSVCFIEGRLIDNKKLLRSDPSYLANLANQSEEQRMRDLEGNWKFKSIGEELIKIDAMERFYNHPVYCEKSQYYASCDIALEGGDNLVMWKWTSNLQNIDDVFVAKLDSRSTVQVVKAKLEQWGVPEHNFTYDLNGLGQYFKGFFPKAVPFVNNGAVNPKFKHIYANLKSQAAWNFADRVNNGEVSINPNLLSRRFSGKGYNDMRLDQILMRERRVLRPDKNNTDNGFALPKKKVMKSLIGHSPDFIESMFMIEIFNISHIRKKIKGLGFL